MEWTWAQLVAWIPFAGVILGTAALVEALKAAWRRLLPEGSKLRDVLEAFKSLLPVAVCSGAALVPGVIPIDMPWIAALGLGALGGGMSAWGYETFRKKAKDRVEGLKLPGEK